MSRTLHLAIVVLLLGGSLLGCRSTERAEPDDVEAADAQAALSGSVGTAVELARAIEADPERAEQVLEQAGMSAEEFESLLYEIAADPELSRQYNRALSH